MFTRTTEQQRIKVDSQEKEIFLTLLSTMYFCYANLALLSYGRLLVLLSFYAYPVIL